MTIDSSDGFDDRIRPYALTGGRTRSTAELPLETQVVRSSLGMAVTTKLGPEHRQILETCSAPTAIVEIAARLRVHLGVARVLVGDMQAAGLVEVHHQRGGNGRPDAATLERVLDGLRNL